MALNYEIERHIRAAKMAGQLDGVDFLKAVKTQFDIAANARIVPVLPLRERTPNIRRPGLQSGLRTEWVSQRYPEIAKLVNQKVGFNGRKLRQQRVYAGLSQTDLGTFMDASQAHVSGIERGDVQLLSLTRAIGICVGLGIRPEAFIDELDVSKVADALNQLGIS